MGHYYTNRFGFEPVQNRFWKIKKSLNLELNPRSGSGEKPEPEPEPRFRTGLRQHYLIHKEKKGKKQRGADLHPLHPFTLSAQLYHVYLCGFAVVCSYVAHSCLCLCAHI